MRLIKTFLVGFVLTLSLSANSEKININFKDLKIMELVEITSKIVNKNILVTEDIRGNVDFISNKPLNKDEVVKVLIYVLEAKGYTLIQNEDIMRIVKLTEGAKNNPPVITSKNKNPYYQMVTEVFPVYNANVDYIASKIRHLITRTAKLVTNRESNSLVITDFKDNIKTVKKVVSLMTSGARKNTEIVILKNIEAEDAKKSLIQIAKSKFNIKVDTEKVDVISNKNNNSLVLIGKKRNIDYLKKYITDIDKNGSLTKRIVEVISLKNVEAKNVIKIIDSIIGKKKYLDPNAKPLASIDEESNAIVLMGPSDEVEYIRTLLKELDKEKAQVYVQARIIEVSDEMLDEVGVKYGIFGGKVGQKGLGTFASSLNGGAALAFSPSVMGLKIPDLTSGLALGASISLLNKDGAIDIVSEPSILAINNKESSIYVGETISVKTSSTMTKEGAKDDNYKREDVGLTLKVKPRISNDNKVTLEINTILEDVKTTQTSSGNADTTKKEVKTTAIVKNGEAVILGGLIEDKEGTSEDKLPILGDIPILGTLFKNDKKSLRKRSLVIIVTPYIIPKSKDLTYVRKQLAELKFLEERYLQKALIRLKKKKLERLKEKAEFDEELKAVEKEFAKYKTDDTKASHSNESEHQKRVNKLLGL